MRRACGLTVVAVFVGAVLSGCGGGDGLQTYGTVAPAALWSEIFSATPPVLIDVRTAAEYDFSRLPHSDSDPNCGCDSLAALAPASVREVVVIGGTEDHARRAARDVALPTDHVRVMAGGFYDWQLGLDISAQQLHDWLLGTRTLRLIDVRTEAEWTAGHIAETANLPLADIATWSHSLAADEEIVCICAGGGRSAQARDYLATQGFTRVHNLLGGTNGWPYGTVSGG